MGASHSRSQLHGALIHFQIEIVSRKLHVFILPLSYHDDSVVIIYAIIKIHCRVHYIIYLLLYINKLWTVQLAATMYLLIIM